MLNSRERLLEREKEILRMLNVFIEQKLNFLVVGGYAIATYKKRFSVDLDLVIKEKDENKFKTILKNNNFSLGYKKKIELVYQEKFERFIKKIKKLPVSIDLLINALISRTTNASWDFNYIKKHSNKRNLNNLKFLIPKKELLIAMKFHSGRLTDIRDIIAIMPCDIKKLKKHIFRGNIKKLKENIKKTEKILQKQEFDDSFKGIFGIHAYNNKDIKETEKLIKNLYKIQT